MVVASAAALLTSCAYVIPPADNAPRHNEVRGEMRRPSFNTPSPVGPQSGVALPAEPRMAMAAPMTAPVPMVASVPPAESVAVAELPPLTAAPTPAPYTAEAARRVPLENHAFQTAAMGFDPITQVPPRPEVTGANSPFDALRATQQEMEQTRVQAYDARDTLARDAAAEPSLLSPLPRATPVPSPRRLDAPSTVVPVAPSVHGQPHSAAPAPLGTPMTALTEEDMVFPPPPEPLGAFPVAAAPAVTPSSPLSAAVKVPVENLSYGAPHVTGAGDVDPLAVASVRTPATVSTIAAPPVVRGDFDPLAVSTQRPLLAAPAAVAAAPVPLAVPASRYAASGLIAPSRYAARRF